MRMRRINNKVQYVKSNKIMKETKLRVRGSLKCMHSSVNKVRNMVGCTKPSGTSLYKQI